MTTNESREIVTPREGEASSDQASQLQVFSMAQSASVRERAFTSTVGRDLHVLIKSDGHLCSLIKICLRLMVGLTLKSS